MPADLHRSLSAQDRADASCSPGVRPDVLTSDDVARMAPALARHPKLVNRLLHLIGIDRINDIHRRWHHSPGIEFSHRLIEDEFRIRERIDGEHVLAGLREGAFVIVSNHPFGALDGIMLLHLVGKYRPDFRVMVNMFLNHISAMRPSFIAVDALQSDDPEKRKVSMQGIRTAIRRVREGHPVGFFPAGAVGKLDRRLRVSDRQWSAVIVRVIRQMGVPVVPIFFHGSNSTFFNILGRIDWRLRTLRLPREVFLKQGGEIHVSIGEPIAPCVLDRYADDDALGRFLREQTYKLREIK